jgi:hypothetical protein
VVLLDLEMPMVAGVEVTWRLRSDERTRQARSPEQLERVAAAPELGGRHRDASGGPTPDAGGAIGLTSDQIPRLSVLWAGRSDVRPNPPALGAPGWSVRRLTKSPGSRHSRLAGLTSDQIPRLSALRAGRLDVRPNPPALGTPGWPVWRQTKPPGSRRSGLVG